jgi:capsular polysaccharide export protein
VVRVNLCLGDRLFWPRRGAIDYRGSLARWPAFVGALMDREGVTDLFLMSEQRPHHLAASGEARARGVTVTVTDYGYLRPAWLTVERDGMMGMSHFPRDPQAILRLAAEFPAPDASVHYKDSFFHQSVWDIVYEQAAAWLWFAYPFFRSHLLAHPLATQAALGLRLMRQKRNDRISDRVVAEALGRGEPCWLFPMQLEVDYSIRAYSPYSGMAEPLEEVIGSFARAAPANGRLFVKVHPFEPDLAGWRGRVRAMARRAGIEDRVTYIDGGDLAAMLAGARGVVTVNSTAGLMALQAGVPTKLLGDTIFDVPGLTYQGPLDRFWSEAAPPEAALLDAFIRAAAGALHVRGVYHRDPGLAAAVTAVADRLDAGVRAEIDAKIARAVAGSSEAPAEALPLPTAWSRRRAAG